MDTNPIFCRGVVGMVGKSLMWAELGEKAERREDRLNPRWHFVGTVALRKEGNTITKGLALTISKRRVINS